MCGINRLATSGNKAVTVQLRIHTMRQGCCTIHTNALTKAPDGVAVRYVPGVLQQAKTLVARAVEQLELHLLIGQVLQLFEHQDAHHNFGGISGPAALTPITALNQGIGQCRQLRKVYVAGYHLQRIPLLIELAFAAGISKQVELQGAAWGDHVLNLLQAARRNWLKAEVLRGSKNY